jgi:2-keto-3-deoxy-galactonokinase
LGFRGAILENRTAAKGILPERREFGALEEQVGDWIAAGEALIMMSGMVGSRQGWAEVLYVQCPAGFDHFAAHLRKVEWGARRGARASSSGWGTRQTTGVVGTKGGMGCLSLGPHWAAR